MLHLRRHLPSAVTYTPAIANHAEIYSLRGQFAATQLMEKVGVSDTQFYESNNRSLAHEMNFT